MATGVIMSPTVAGAEPPSTLSKKSRSVTMPWGFPEPSATRSDPMPVVVITLSASEGGASTSTVATGEEATSPALRWRAGTRRCMEGRDWKPRAAATSGNGTIGASGCRIARAVKAAAARLARIDKIMEGVDELLRGAPPSLGSRSSLQVLFNDLLPTAMAVARSTIWMCVAVAAVAPPFLTAAKGWRCWCLPAARHRRPAGARGRTGHIKDHQDLATSPRSLAAAARESATDHKLWAAWENREAA